MMNPCHPYGLPLKMEKRMIIDFIDDHSLLHPWGELGIIYFIDNPCSFRMYRDIISLCLCTCDPWGWPVPPLRATPQNGEENDHIFHRWSFSSLNRHKPGHFVSRFIVYSPVITVNRDRISSCLYSLSHVQRLTSKMLVSVRCDPWGCPHGSRCMETIWNIVSIQRESVRGAPVRGTRDYLCNR